MSESPATKPYTKPILERREPVALATALKAISQKINKAPKPCWVARAVYGADNPRWLLFRDWLAFQAPAGIRRIYVRHGEAFAHVVGRSALLRRILRPLMDRAIRARFGGRAV